MYNVRTPIPRYSTTWDVTKVTSYLATLILFPLDQVSLTNLTFKTVMLCALSSTQREQTLCALDLKNKRESGTCLSFVITEHLKTSKPGKSTEVTFECLPDQPQICMHRMVTIFKLKYNLIDCDFDLPKINHLYNTRQRDHIHLSKHNTNWEKQRLLYHACKEYNDLDNNIKSIKELDSFYNALLKSPKY